MIQTTKDDMPRKIAVLVDIIFFLDMQRQERYRSFIVHGPPGKGKTVFAQKLAALTGGVYIDVLANVATTPELAGKVDVLDVDFLKEIGLEAASNGASLVVLDEFDFLLPIWGGDLSIFIEMVRKLSTTETKAVICFMIQTTDSLDTSTLENSIGQSRILRLDEIQGLK